MKKSSQKMKKVPLLLQILGLTINLIVEHILEPLPN